MDFYPELEDPQENVQFQFSTLPDLWQKYNIPRLPDKPQDPILDTLRFHQQRFQSQKEIFGLDGALPPLPRINLDNGDWSSSTAETHDVWAAAMKPVNLRSHQNDIMSWEALWLPRQGSQPSMLSENGSHALSAALHCFSPKFHDSATHVVNVSIGELVRCLQNVLTGTTTSLYTWNAEQQLLLPNGSSSDKVVQLSISGLDDTIGQSIVKRFLSIGTLARRLDILVSDMRNLAKGKRQDLHSFTHALESISAEVKKRIFHFTWSTPDDFEILDIHTLTILWSSCADYEDLLHNLLSLCGRSMAAKPAEYPPPFASAADILTVLYERLEIHMEGNSPRMITGMFAFLLSSVSSDYFERLSSSVGYSQRALSTVKPPSSSRRTGGLLDDDVQDGDETIEEANLDEVFPSFFGMQFSKAVIRARQSLVLLRAAQPDHPLLNSSITRPKIRWFWSEDEVALVWDQSSPPQSPVSSESVDADLDDVDVPRPQSEGAFSCLRTFDMEPGTHLVGRPSADTDFGDFIATFPERLPSLTPTLQSLKDLILEPLEAHINSLSAALVDVFVSSNEYLNLHHHLVLLRSYVLLTSHAFKLRLQSALFSGVPEVHGVTKDARSIAVQARASKKAKKSAEPSGPNWVIGIAPSLTEGNTWPPGGSDLGWHLRAVILDSLAADFPDKLNEDMKQDSGSAQVVREAEWRLGFAIRGLSTASGRAKWLDPKSMEALDFLYMDYHPPHPLDVLIPSSTLSKYHRLFAFNLRLMRVQNVMEALFRMTSRSDPLFETLTPSNKLFLHFRFLAHTVVTTISSYVYDTAIGGHFDAFLSTLTPSTHPPTAPASPLQSSTASRPHQTSTSALEPQPHLSDVFALGERHSEVLDDIIGACLLRSSQKAAGEVLRGILDTVLKFGILMSDLAAHRVREYEAAAPLEDLYELFRRRCIALVRALKGLIDASSAGTQDIDDVHLQMMSGSLTGVAASLHNLLVRLDVSEWWDRQRPRS